MLCLEPDYLEDFFCDGQRCGAQCCRLWTVFVDEGTYGKYRQLPREQGEEILAHLAPGEPGQAPWAWDFGGKQVCHFLREDCLCGIQKAHGESYLGNTCAIYPRKAVNIGGNFQRSLALSCPLAAELAVCRESPVVFKWREREPGRPDSWQEIACGQGEEGLAAACLLLQDTGLAILQLKLPLWERLSALLAYLTAADKAVEAGDFEALLQLSDEYGHGGGEREEGLGWDLDRHFPGLRAALPPVAEKNQHLGALHAVETSASLPPAELLLENTLVSEYFTELFPCTLEGTLRHNGRAFFALALLYREAIEEARPQGASQVILAVSRLATLMGHDRDWQETLSRHI